MEKTKKGSAVNKALMMGSTALISLTALPAQDAHAATGTGAMSAIILAPIVISGTQVLHFGSMTDTGGGGTMAIDTAGVRTAGGNTTEVVGAGAEQAGVLQIQAATGLAIDISMTAATFTVDDVGAGAPMNVNAFNLNTNGGGPTIVYTLAAATETIPMGATLTVGAAQVPGTYTGTYTVNANYQ